MSAAAEAAAVGALREWAAEVGLELAEGARPGEFAVELPGEAKLRTTVSVLVGNRALSVSAFVVRRPDENHERFHRWLLTRNSRLPGVAFALDPAGDVYLLGRLPLVAVTVTALDELFGVLLSTADGSFNELLALGFLGSMRREWAWRTERGESTRNLAAFEHLLTGPSETTGGPVEPDASGGRGGVEGVH